ncbi:kynureninase [Roseicyclus sp. F158]|uniref:Kynureninase n=1 Tax=Tropicimonas omnivorans TaxID=3075590 RepID=A0ABU3DJH3_9RHOB|nr:kynureninase [Roseicyclus sp. F158]MDT0683872.1 kynureninase [Roseicyclus sp. F158]
MMKERFILPDGLVYLDGNSLGPLPRGAAARVGTTMELEWGRLAIAGWNRAGWIGQPMALGDRIGRLIGAEPGSVSVGDTLSVKVFQLVAAALAMRPERKVVLSDSGNFPSDLYMADGLAEALGDVQLVVVEPEEIAGRIGPDVAVLMLTEVDYRTGRKHDMAALTRAAHEAGALTVWDLAHSAGALPVELAGAGADFACGCTYKYLNGGPGAPGFAYVAPRHADTARTILQGWLGHAEPFAFEPGYRPAAGAERMRVGTPPILQMAALEAALDIWDEVDVSELRARSIVLSERFIAAVESACPDIALVSPRDPEARGSQVSFRFEHGYAAMQALIAHGVVGDFRAPDIMRFGITPLYLSEEDIDVAAGVIAKVMTERLWDDPAYATRSAVT